MEENDDISGMMTFIGWLAASLICLMFNVNNPWVIVIAVVFVGWFFDFLYRIYKNKR